MERSWTRRNFIKTAAGVGLALSFDRVFAAEQKSHVQQVTVNEDLMREHGLLERVLLIYEEIQRRFKSSDYRLEDLNESAGIIKHFVEDYHEKLEENYLFPRFRAAHKLVGLVDTLQAQHDKGRRITAEILRLSGSGTGNKDIHHIDVLMSNFIHMYRPHYAREDTIVFPAFKNLVSPKEYQDLGERFEDKEHQLFGENGFEKVLGRVEGIEKRLGIYDLSRYGS